MGFSFDIEKFLIKPKKSGTDAAKPESEAHKSFGVNLDMICSTKQSQSIVNNIENLGTDVKEGLDDTAAKKPAMDSTIQKASSFEGNNILDNLDQFIIKRKK